MSSHLTTADIAQLESSIDTLQKQTPEPTTFVLPGGCTAAAESHICRTVTRRAERSMVAMSHQYRVDPLAMQYVNRLSDYFFVLALNLNFISSIEEKKTLYLLQITQNLLFLQSVRAGWQSMKNSASRLLEKTY